MTRSRSMLVLVPCLLAACSPDAAKETATADQPAAAPTAEQPAPPAAAAEPAPAATAEPAATPPTPSPAAPAAAEGQVTPVRVEGEPPPAEGTAAAPEPATDPATPPPAAGEAIPASVVATMASPPIGQWISLFNGQNLDGWTIKMTHHPLNENYLNTFRVEDGLLKVVYADYGPFGGEFGHIFYTGFQTVFSHYRVRVEYRIVGTQVAGGPDWGYRNNGIMLHSQAPETMTLDQDFPTSLEFQFLGSDEGEASTPRPTGNVCSPGTNVVMNGQLITIHCVLTSTLVVRGEQWVTAEAEVLGSDSITYTVNGQVTSQYTNPQYDPNDPNAQPLIKSADLMLREGAIALQAESHPTEFRKVEIMLLDPNAPATPPTP